MSYPKVKFGIDRLMSDPALRAPLKGRRVALVAHPASVTADLTHSLDALMSCDDIEPVSYTHLTLPTIYSV